jgi:hypothetical protein
MVEDSSEAAIVDGEVERCIGNQESTGGECIAEVWTV